MVGGWKLALQVAVHLILSATHSLNIQPYNTTLMCTRHDDFLLASRWWETLGTAWGSITVTRSQMCSQVWHYMETSNILSMNLLLFMMSRFCLKHLGIMLHIGDWPYHESPCEFPQFQENSVCGAWWIALTYTHSMYVSIFVRVASWKFFVTHWPSCMAFLLTSNHFSATHSRDINFMINFFEFEFDSIWIKIRF